MQPTGSDRPRVEATTAAAAAAAASQGEAPEGEAPEAEAPPPTYRFAFSWEGPYGKAVNLVEAHAPPGAILDLGCGYGAVAEVLSEKGRDYIGADADGVALADLGVRGFETHEIDLCSGDLGARLKDVVAGRALGAVLLLDALEHLPEPEALLASLADFMVSANPGAPPPVLVASIPNVAHLDLAAKLVAGLWDVTPSGLLDRTHLQLFTEDRVTGELARHGFAECGRSDVVLERSDQHFPPDHPYLVEGGPVHEHLRALRAAAGPNMTVNQFVRAYTVGEGPRTPPSVVAPPLRKPLLSILTRTQGSRPSMLAETLTCLAAQSFEDFEVLLLVHGDDPGVLANCRDLVGRFDEGFSSRVRVVPVPGGGGRTAPLNRGLELAEGRYVAFLDDDDLVTADWAGAFAEGIERAPGKVVRSGCLARHVRRPGAGEAAMGGVPVTLTRPLPEFAGRFDVLAHLAVNQTTNLSVAIPHALVTELELRFNERNEVCEDWELLVRAALVVGVEDTGRLTGIYQRWDDGGSSTASSAPGAWTETPRRMRADLDSRPLLLPPGSASKIGHLVRDPELGRKRLLEVELVEAIAAIKSARAEAVAAETRAASAEERTAAAESHAATTEARAVAAEERTAAAECRAATAETRAASAEERTAAAERAHNEIAQSEFWRLTAPIRLPLSRLAARRRPRP